MVCSGESYKIGDLLFGSFKVGLSLTQLSQIGYQWVGLCSNMDGIVWNVQRLFPGFGSDVEGLQRVGKAEVKKWKKLYCSISHAGCCFLVYSEPNSGLGKKCSTTALTSKIRVPLQMLEITYCQTLSTASVHGEITLTLLSWRPDKISSLSPMPCALWEKVLERKVCIL